MPIYEYECSKCGKTIEVIQRMKDRPLKKHEACGGVLTKLISRAGFQFKGTGWYVTDYAGKKNDKSEKSEKAASGESTTGGETASKSKDDSKPAAKVPTAKPGKE